MTKPFVTPAAANFRYLVQFLTDDPDRDEETNDRIDATVPFDQQNMPLSVFPIPPCVTTEYWDRQLRRVSKNWREYDELNRSASPINKAQALSLIYTGRFYKEALKKIRRDLYTAADMCKTKFGNDSNKAYWDLEMIGIMRNGREHGPSRRFRGLISTAPA